MELNTRNGKIELNVGDVVVIDSETFPAVGKVAGFDFAPLDNSQKVKVNIIHAQHGVQTFLVDAYFGDITKIPDGYNVKRSTTRDGRSVDLVYKGVELVAKFWENRESAQYLLRKAKDQARADKAKAPVYNAEVRKFWAVLN
jgi:hypothetical protein